MRESQQISGDRVDARLDRLAVAIMDERVQRSEDYNGLIGAISDTNQNASQMVNAMGQLSQTVAKLSADVRSLTAEMDQLRAMMMTHLRRPLLNGQPEVKWWSA